jgi:hypothetical protein
MNGACDALKEPLEDVFRKFAYLDLELRPIAQEFLKKWSLCTRVRCGGDGNVLVLLMCSPELAESVANNFLGLTEGSRPGQRIDIVSELTNVLAGHAYEILRAGIRPKVICPPELLGIREAMEIWDAAPADSRFAVCSETELLGGMLVIAQTEWSHP